MAKTKQKFSFQALITNTNAKQSGSTSFQKELITCKLRILSFQTSQTTPNLKWNNYIQILTDVLHTMSVNKLTSDDTFNIDWYKSSDKTSIGAGKDFSDSNAPTAYEIPSAQSEIIAVSGSLVNTQHFLLYCHTPLPIEDLIQLHPESPAVGQFKVTMKVQLVDESGVYADSDPVEISAIIGSGTVSDKPQ